jgi:hypothetical protein
MGKQNLEGTITTYSWLSLNDDKLPDRSQASTLLYVSVGLVRYMFEVMGQHRLVNTSGAWTFTLSPLGDLTKASGYNRLTINPADVKLKRSGTRPPWSAKHPVLLWEAP